MQAPSRQPHQELMTPMPNIQRSETPETKPVSRATSEASVTNLNSHYGEFQALRRDFNAGLRQACHGLHRTFGMWKMTFLRTLNP